jgi:hypothetical protein
MININKKDDHLQKLIDSGKFGFETKYNYRIYGLKPEGNPAILLEYTKGGAGAEKAMKNAATFFKNNKINAQVAKTDTGDSDIYIGLRMDLRKDDKTMVAALNTILHSLEGKLKLVKTKKVKCPEYK